MPFSRVPLTTHNQYTSALPFAVLPFAFEDLVIGCSEFAMALFLVSSVPAFISGPIRPAIDAEPMLLAG